MILTFFFCTASLRATDYVSFPAKKTPNTSSPLTFSWSMSSTNYASSRLWFTPYSTYLSFKCTHFLLRVKCNPLSLIYMWKKEVHIHINYSNVCAITFFFVKVLFWKGFSCLWITRRSVTCCSKEGKKDLGCGGLLHTAAETSAHVYKLLEAQDSTVR